MYARVSQQTEEAPERLTCGILELPCHLELASKSSDNARAKNTEAQRKFRARLKANKLDLSRKLEQVNAQLSDLQSEKQELERHQFRINHVLDAQTIHIEQLFSYPKVRGVQQRAIMSKAAQLASKLRQRQVPLEEACTWSMRQWMCGYLKEYLFKLASLHADICATGSASSQFQLHELIEIKHDLEKLGEHFSCIGWAHFAWNLEESRKCEALPPDDSHWLKAIEGLKLSPEQIKTIVAGRSSMLLKLKAIAADRMAIVARLGLQLLDYEREQVHLCPATKDLRESFEKERTTVYTFLVTICDATLTPVQEAFLDAHSWPWCADILRIADLIASGEQEDRTLEGLAAAPPDLMNVPGRALAPILPHFSAYQVLVTPLTAVGTGIRSKRGLVLNPVFTVECSLAFPLPTQMQLQDMPLAAVHGGAWKEYTFWEWLMMVQKRGRPFSNRLTVASDSLTPQ